MSHKRYLPPVLRKLRIHHAGLIVSALAILAALGVQWVGSLTQPYIAKDFAYSGDLHTTEVPYDTITKRYGEETYALTNYTLQAVSTNSTTTLLRTTRSSTSEGAHKTTTVSQEDTINAHSGRYTPSGRTQSPDTYLFAPRNIDKGESFVSRYPGYDAIATMRYQAEEQVYDLSTYRYTAEYSGDIVAPVQDGSDKHLLYRPKVTVWIEPTTGWLIKSQEETNLYREDMAGSNAQPMLAGHISRTFTDASVRQHVDYAQQLKYRLDLGKQVAPGILLAGMTLIGAIILAQTRRLRGHGAQIMASIVLIVGLANMAGWIWHSKPLLTILPGNIAINPIISVAFMCTALSILLLSRNRYAGITIGLGVTVIVIAAISALHTAALIPFDIDTLLFHDSVLAIGTSMPDRISLFGSVGFLILGTSIVKIAAASNAVTIVLARLAAGMVVCLGAAAVLAKLLLLDEVFIVPHIASLSLGGSVLYILCGLAVLQVALRHHIARQQEDQRQTTGQALLLPALLTIPLVLLGIAAQFQQDNLKHQLQGAFDTEIKKTQQSITESITSYTQALKGVQSLYAASVAVERAEWETYINRLSIGTAYPAISGIGFVQQVDATSLPTLTRTLRQTGSPAFSIFPGSQRQEYSPIIYMSPPQGMNQQLVGFDIAADSIRYGALQAALVSSEPTASGKLSLMRETGSDTVGFLMVLPVYKNNHPTSTPFERHQAITGYIYTPIVAQRFFQEALKKQNSAIDVAVYDGTSTNSDQLLYSQNVPGGLSQNGSRLTETKTIYANKRPWTVVYTAKPSFTLANAQERVPSLILVGGGTVYLLSVTATFWLISLRRLTRASAKRRNTGAEQP